VLPKAVADWHAGFSIGLTTQAPPRVYTLFPNGWFDMQRVVRPIPTDCLGNLGNAEVRDTINDLHRRMNNGEDTQVEIDRYLFYVYLEGSGKPPLPNQSFPYELE